MSHEGHFAIYPLPGPRRKNDKPRYAIAAVFPGTDHPHDFLRNTQTDHIIPYNSQESAERRLLSLPASFSYDPELRTIDIPWPEFEGEYRPFTFQLKNWSANSGRLIGKKERQRIADAMGERKS